MSRRTLKGITWDHPRGLDCLVRCADAYRETHDVDIRWSARSLKDFGDAPINQLANEFDLLVIDHPHVGWAQSTGALAPLDYFLSVEQLEKLRAQSAGPAHASYDFAGHHWAVAVDIAMQAASFRPDLLSDPLPKNWNGVISLAQKIRQRGQWMAVPLAPTDAICLFISLCAGAGDSPGRRDDGWFVSDVIGRAALCQLREIAAAMLPEALSWNPIRLLDAMAERDDLVYCPASFIYSNYARANFRRKQLRFADLPGPRGSCLGGAGLAVSAQSANTQAAADFAFWVGEAAIQRTLYVQAGGQPGNRAAWDDDTANALTNAFFRDTRSTLEGSYVRPRHEAWPAFQEEAGNRIHAWLQAAPNSGGAELLRHIEELYSAMTPRIPKPQSL